MDHEQTSQPPIGPSLAAEHAVSQSEHPQVVAAGSFGTGNSASAHDNGLRHSGSGSTVDQRLLNPSEGRAIDNPYTDFERVPPPPAARSRDGQVRVSSRRQTFGASGIGLPIGAQLADTSGLDWIVPVNEKSATKHTLGERLQPTIDNAVLERDKYAKKALWTGYAINIAIGLQVLLGALTTGLSAAVTTAKQAQVSTAVLGGLSTLVASYLARSRGSGEPELSITRVKDLEQFLRECRAFQLDHAHEYGTPQNQLSERLDNLRRRFEELLGNANGERKLSPTGITPSQTV